MGNVVLRQFRLSLGLSQVELARAAGLNATYICQVELGGGKSKRKKPYRLGHRAALAIFDAFGAELAEARITLADLLRGEPRRAA